MLHACDSRSPGILRLVTGSRSRGRTEVVPVTLAILTVACSVQGHWRDSSPARFGVTPSAQQTPSTGRKLDQVAAGMGRAMPRVRVLLIVLLAGMAGAGLGYGLSRALHAHQAARTAARMARLRPSGCIRQINQRGQGMDHRLYTRRVDHRRPAAAPPHKQAFALVDPQLQLVGGEEGQQFGVCAPHHLPATGDA